MHGNSFYLHWISFLSNLWHKRISLGCIWIMIYIVHKHQHWITLFCFLFSIGKQQKTNNELEEMKGIFYQNPVIIAFIFTVAVLVSQMTWQAHSCISLCHRSLLGCHWALVSFCSSKVCYFVRKQDRSISVLDE